MIFHRKLYAEMLRWKSDFGGSMALLIKGARRVGKSTLAETFARNEYRTFIAIDFTECPPTVRELFDDISNLDFIFMRLQMIYGVELHNRESVIVFDEVQNCPKARQAIKYLVKDGRYDYIETGSLLSIRQNVKDILIPSEEYSVCLYPMDYEEFNRALGNEAVVPVLRKFYDMGRGLGDSGNREEMRRFRLYMLVGGMPQAVKAYIETNNMARVDAVKRAIIDLYEQDFIKIDPSGNASKMFRDIPAQLSANFSRYQVAPATDGGRPSRLSETVYDMQDSMVVNIAYHANDPNVGMALHRDTGRFKMYLGDTGLFVTLAFWDKSFTENIIYEKLLADKLSADLGYVYENAVAQMLRAAGHQLFYYTWQAETSNRRYEIDFLLSRGAKIQPLEVKSSGYKAHRSLDLFIEKYSARVTAPTIIYTKDLRREGGVTYLPAYMTPFL